MDDGQAYVDELHGFTVRQSAALMEPYLDAVLRVIAEGKSYGEIQAGLRKLYAEQGHSPELVELTERAYLMAQYAGHLQVTEDAEDDLGNLG